MLNRESLIKGRQAFMMTVSEEQFYFSKAIVQTIGLTTGRYVTFIDTTKEYWTFICNDDDKGFRFIINKAGGGFLRLRELPKHFCRVTKHKFHLLPMSFAVTVVTGELHEGKQVFKIHFEKTFEEYIKQ